MDLLLGLTRVPTTVNKFSVTTLQPILTSLLIIVDVFTLVVPHLFSVKLIYKKYECLGRNFSATVPFMPIRLYKRYDLG